MLNRIGAHLVELNSAAQAISDKMIGFQPLYFSHQSATYLDGGVVKIVFETHDARNAAAVDRARKRFHKSAASLSGKSTTGAGRCRPSGSKSAATGRGGRGPFQAPSSYPQLCWWSLIVGNLTYHLPSTVKDLF